MTVITITLTTMRMIVMTRQQPELLQHNDGDTWVMARVGPMMMVVVAMMIVPFVRIAARKESRPLKMLFHQHSAPPPLAL